MKNKLFIWETIGAIFIIAVGTLMHFTYEWTNGNQASALFSAVNESTWEHMKIAFWPGVFFLIIELFFLYPKVNNFWTAKTAALIFPAFLIPILFYSYTGLLGFHVLIIDIIIFAISIIAGQYASYKVLTMDSLPKVTVISSVFVLLLMLCAFSTFSYFPPNNELFKTYI